MEPPHPEWTRRLNDEGIFETRMPDGRRVTAKTSATINGMGSYAIVFDAPMGRGGKPIHCKDVVEFIAVMYGFYQRGNNGSYADCC